jgi:hypothetical protein
LTQLPINAKDWSVALPASILGLVAFIYVLVWAVKQLAPVFSKPDAPAVKNGNGGLSPSQKMEVRDLIESMVIRQGQPGGLHDLSNKLKRILWAAEDKEERRKEPRSGREKD